MARKLSLPLLSGLFLLAACAFDVINLRLSPTRFEPVSDAPQEWVLRSDVKVTLVSGWATALKKGTTWKQVGTVIEGTVLKTRDQIVTVEASDIFEAEPVINGGRIVGFYLPVDKAFTPADPAAPVELDEVEAASASFRYQDFHRGK